MIEAGLWRNWSAITELLNDDEPLALSSLPEPTQRRWQPLRTGFIELFHCDSEEFWFPNGHLLLRGNNERRRQILRTGGTECVLPR